MSLFSRPADFDGLLEHATKDDSTLTLGVGRVGNQSSRFHMIMEPISWNVALNPRHCRWPPPSVDDGQRYEKRSETLGDHGDICSTIRSSGGSYCFDSSPDSRVLFDQGNEPPAWRPWLLDSFETSVVLFRASVGFRV